ncbi:winged helix-turn-helix transcriptional regulator [Amycolatopsis sp. cmx-4-61]|uniref:winged helix-turn-helix transcriptional regulator n=1 Tax=Amycolatopsis sp. cmx-4-61 TaxID=2790937 RepID=UPI00397B6E6D
MQLTERDLELVDAVQINPRAGWSAIARPLGISAVTAARRWAALVAEGAVWTGAVMGPLLFRGAVLEFACRPAAVDSLVDALNAMPDVLTVGRTVGEFDVYALTAAPTTQTLISSLSTRFAGLPAERLRARAYTRVHGGPQWRLNVLNPAQSAQVRDPARPRHEAAGFAPADRDLFFALAQDARRSYADLSQELSAPPQVVRRRLERLRRAGWVSLRADLARPLAGWPLAALLWLEVPHADRPRLAHELGTRAAVRFCASTVAPANLVAIVNLRAPEELDEVLTALAADLPSVAVREHRLVLRLHKVNGHILDPEGRSVRVVPVDPWIAEDSLPQ